MMLQKIPNIEDSPFDGLVIRKRNLLERLAFRFGLVWCDWRWEVKKWHRR